MPPLNNIWGQSSAGMAKPRFGLLDDADPVQAGVNNANLEERYRAIAPEYTKDLALQVYGASPFGNWQDAAGLMPNARGELQPSIRENVSQGNYLSAGLQAGGIVGGPILKGLLGVAAKVAPAVKGGLLGIAKGAGASKAMFLGAGAKTADKEAMALAHHMDASGASREDIWNKTGWFKGVDGKWRFETPDNEATLKGYIQPGAQFDGMLTDAINHDALLGGKTGTPFGAYPSLHSLKYGYSPGLYNDARGSYYPNGYMGEYMDEGIHVSNNHQEPLSTTLHEIQHAIQERENFARGGNPGDETLHRVPSEAMEKWQKAIENDKELQEAIKLYNSPEYEAEKIKSNKWYRSTYHPKIQEIERKVAAAPHNSPEQDELMGQYDSLIKQMSEEDAKLHPLIRKVDGMSLNLRKRNLSIVPPQNEYLSPYDAYRRVAGEVEARTTQKRMGMTAEERKARYPWLDYDVPEEQQIVRFRGGLLSK